MLDSDETHERWMRHALALADKAQVQGEVPVGAVLISDGQLLAEGWNQPIAMHDPTSHAEIMAVRQACQRINNYRLTGATTLYVTLEPCAMCAGALVHARVSQVVFGASDPKTGAAGSVFEILGTDKLNHQISVIGGILAEECSEKIRSFFRMRR